MIIQNSLKILNEITEIEVLINDIEKCIKDQRLDIDLEEILINIIRDSEC